MSRVKHVNDDGVLDWCRADPNNPRSTGCDFGDTPHFTPEQLSQMSDTEVRSMSESIVQERLKKKGKNTNPTMSKMSRAEFQQLHEENLKNAEAFKTADDAYWEAYERYKASNRGKGSFKHVPVTDELFELHQQRRQAMYAFAVTDTEHNKYAEDFGVDRNELPVTSYDHYNESIANFEAWKAKQEAISGEKYAPNPNPSMNGAAGQRHYNKAKMALCSLTGKKPWDVDKSVDRIMVRDGVDRDTAMKQYYLTAEKRKDKPFVYLDLETAARTKEDVGTIDEGHYADIIEVGYIKEYPDGQQEKGSMLFDVDKNLKSVAGTGAQNIHNITPEMVEGKPNFRDPEVQEKMKNVLNGSVLVAHNTNFEESQLSWNLKGFAQARNSYQMDTLDTQTISSVFVNTVNGNKNQDFVETTGGKYSADAHRAYIDAEMTKNALDEVLSNKKKYLDGNHENNKRLAAEKAEREREENS